MEPASEAAAALLVSGGAGAGAASGRHGGWEDTGTPSATCPASPVPSPAPSCGQHDEPCRAHHAHGSPLTANPADTVTHSSSRARDHASSPSSPSSTPHGGHASADASAYPASTSASYSIPSGGYFEWCWCPHYGAEVGIYACLAALALAGRIILVLVALSKGVGTGRHVASASGSPEWQVHASGDHASGSNGVLDAARLVNQTAFLLQWANPLLLAVWVGCNLAVTALRTKAWYEAAMAQMDAANARASAAQAGVGATGSGRAPSTRGASCGQSSHARDLAQAIGNHSSHGVGLVATLQCTGIPDRSESMRVVAAAAAALHLRAAIFPYIL